MLCGSDCSQEIGPLTGPIWLVKAYICIMQMLEQFTYASIKICALQKYLIKHQA